MYTHPLGVGLFIYLQGPVLVEGVTSKSTVPLAPNFDLAVAKGGQDRAEKKLYSCV